MQEREDSTTDLSKSNVAKTIDGFKDRMKGAAELIILPFKALYELYFGLGVLTGEFQSKPKPKVNVDRKLVLTAVSLLAIPFALVLGGLSLIAQVLVMPFLLLVSAIKDLYNRVTLKPKLVISAIYLKPVDMSNFTLPEFEVKSSFELINSSMINQNTYGNAATLKTVLSRDSLYPINEDIFLPLNRGSLNTLNSLAESTRSITQGNTLFSFNQPVLKNDDEVAKINAWINFFSDKTGTLIFDIFSNECIFNGQYSFRLGLDFNCLNKVLKSEHNGLFIQVNDSDNYMNYSFPDVINMLKKRLADIKVKVGDEPKESLSIYP